MRSLTVWLVVLTHCPLSLAQTFVPTTIEDSIDVLVGDGVCADAVGECSLRAAVMEANALPGRQRIHLPPGVYLLDRVGATENASMRGDLDILDDLDITGAGMDASILDAGGIDRVIDIAPGATAVSVSVGGLSVTGGVRPIVPVTDGRGGGIRIGTQGELDLMDAAIRNNSAGGSGGGIRNEGRLRVRRSRIENNTITGSGGTGAGLATGANDTGFAQLTDTLVRGNHGANRGGGIAVVRDDPPGGIPMAGFGELHIERSALIGNGATFGGAFYADSPGTFLLRNSTVSGNQANAGAGLFIDNGCDTRIEFSTVTANVSDSIGGAYQNVHGPSQPHLSVVGSILAGNVPDDCRGPAQSEGYNLVQAHPACNWIVATGDLLDVEPLLGPLLDKPGRTPCHEPDAASPAVDTATGDCPATDQNGLERPADGNDDGVVFCDKGAVERGTDDGIFIDGFDPLP
jgi:hypothetical protein